MRKELTNLRGEGLVTEVSLDVWEVAGVSAGNTPPPARIMGSSSKRADPSASAATAASLLPAMSPVHEEAGIKTVYVMVDINNFASIAEGLKKEEWENTLGRAVKFVAFCGAGVTWTSGEFDHIQVGKRTPTTRQTTAMDMVAYIREHVSTREEREIFFTISFSSRLDELDCVMPITCANAEEALGFADVYFKCYQHVRDLPSPIHDC